MKMIEHSQNKLYERRRELHLSQKEAGEMIGMSASLYSKYETGTRFPSVFTALNIATAFGVSVEYLFGVGTDYKKSLPKKKDSYE